MYLKIIFMFTTFVSLSAQGRVHSNNCMNNRCVCKTSTSRKDRMLSPENVTCRLQNFVTVPALQLAHAAWGANSIDLGQNEITELTANIFSQQTKLKKLLLDNNYIEEMDEACFNVSTTSTQEENVSPLQYVDLTGNHLHFVPSCFGKRDITVASLNNLETLLLGNNLFGSTIDLHSFSSVKNLAHLNLTNNGISLIPDLFFKRLPRLRSLDLSWNSLKGLSRMLFAQRVPLKRIRLDHNLLPNIPPNLPVALEELRLASNKLKNITRDDASELNHLEKLRILDLSQNDIELIIYGAFSYLGHLVYLDLSDNALNFLERNVFFGARSLEYVFLHNNKFLVDIADFTFSTLPNLSHLFLQSCRLNSLLLEDADSPKSLPLRYLWVFDNPIICNCRLVPLVRYLKNGHVGVDTNFGDVIVASKNLRVNKAVKAQLRKLKDTATPSLCAKPLNRHYEVVGKPILTVPEGHMTCPDDPFNLVVSCFLGLATFTGVIPVVFFFVQVYLIIIRFARKHFTKEDQETED